MLGGLAEFSSEELTILADTASSVEEFDVAELTARIEQCRISGEDFIGEELDRAIEQLDHFKAVHRSLTPTTAF